MCFLPLRLLSEILAFYISILKITDDNIDRNGKGIGRSSIKIFRFGRKTGFKRT